MNYLPSEESFSKKQACGAQLSISLMLRSRLWALAIAILPFFESSALSQVAFSLNDQAQASDYHSPFDAFEEGVFPKLACESKSTFTMLFGIDGSKEPQDFGVNANLGVIGQLSFSAPLIPNAGVGFQIGNTTSFSGNAVQVFELLGETKDRFQNFTTVGLFQRLDSGISWGMTYDFLSAESFDSFQLGQWRVGAAIDVGLNFEIGVTVNLADRSDRSIFNTEVVELDPIEQLRVHFRRQWETGVNTTFWVGVADQHSEENAVTGTLPNKQNQILFGADVFAPLNHWLAIFGETNLVMPSDTGVVNAYLGMQISPQSIRRAHFRGNRYRPFLPVAAGPSFSVDLNRR